MEALTPRVPEFAHYYGDLIWDEELNGWIKSLLLFFDGIALALPPAKADRLIEANPVLAQPLAELGLLRNYDPDLWTKPDFWINVPPRLKEWERFLTQIWPIVQRTSQGESMSEKDLRDFRAARETSDVGEELMNITRRFISAKEKYGGTPSQMRAVWERGIFHTPPQVRYRRRDSACH